MNPGYLIPNWLLLFFPLLASFSLPTALLSTLYSSYILPRQSYPGPCHQPSLPGGNSKSALLVPGPPIRAILHLQISGGWSRGWDHGWSCLTPPADHISSSSSLQLRVLPLTQFILGPESSVSPVTMWVLRQNMGFEIRQTWVGLDQHSAAESLEGLET